MQKIKIVFYILKNILIMLINLGRIGLDSQKENYILEKILEKDF
jgi:hypothetical protein